MKNHPDFRACRLFFYGLLFLLLTGSLMLLIIGKSGCFISLNAYHPFSLNVFFINYTFFGDGIFACCLILALYFYFKQRRQAATLLFSFLLSGLVTQFLKNYFNSPRPKLYFEAGQYLHFVDGVTLASHTSFPSGHTTTAFAIVTVMVLSGCKRNRQVQLLLAAAMVGYSRIYLAQHFLLDIIAGAIIGTSSAVISFYLAINFKEIKLGLAKIRTGSAHEHSPSNSFPQPV